MTPSPCLKLQVHIILQSHTCGFGTHLSGDVRYFDILNKALFRIEGSNLQILGIL